MSYDDGSEIEEIEFVEKPESGLEYVQLVPLVSSYARCFL